MIRFIKWFEEISLKDLQLVGGKSASLGEMYQTLGSRGIRIPPGFALTADAFTALMDQGPRDLIYKMLAELDPRDTEKLSSAGRQVREQVRLAGLPHQVKEELLGAYRMLSRRAGVDELDVAVRSSATAEDLPDASFAGQQETFLNIRGEQALADAALNCMASLFTDRAISYRTAHGYKHSDVRLSVCVQQMVRSDLGASGVIFTLDTESGATNVVLITSAYGLGENVVGGKVDPDEILVLKPLLETAALPILRRRVGSKRMKLVYSGHGSRTTRNIEVSQADQEILSITDQDVIQLARWACTIEGHYSRLSGRDCPMDIEWGKDGRSGELFILQARPETVHSSSSELSLVSYVLKKKSEILLTGRAVGTKIGAGQVQVIRDAREISKFREGNVLVTDMTDPDWEPIMKRASAIVTNRGGRTCHAAIVSREHGVPCLVGTGTATKRLTSGDSVTVSCSEGEEGHVYNGILPFVEERVVLTSIPKTSTRVMVNLGNPAQALKISRLPVDGVGLARVEFIISEMIRVHPMALLKLNELADGEEKDRIYSLLGGYAHTPEEFFVDKLAEGIGVIAGAFYPRPVIVRFSDFKSNEYAGLLGGRAFEPIEANPMIGFRGASRYYDPRYRDGFGLECRAIRKVREEMGLQNVKVMVPFCRSPEEGRRVLRELEGYGLSSGKDDLEVYVMSELPANILRAGEFAQIFQGFSIGSNDLTQMVLGTDRDSSVISHLFDERDPAVIEMLRMAIRGAKAGGRPIGICGQAPSDFPEITTMLVREGINSISVTPDMALKTIRIVAEAEVAVSKDSREVQWVDHASRSV